MSAEPTVVSQLTMLAAYHGWANSTLLARIGEVPDGPYYAPAGLFFKSIHGTLNHLLLADRSWYGRFIGKPESYASLALELESDRHALAEQVAARHLLWQGLIDRAPSSMVAGQLHYRTTAGTASTTPWAGTLIHVFNHATHHRGQLTAALTGMGYECPELDLIYYLRLANSPAAKPGRP